MKIALVWLAVLLYIQAWFYVVQEDYAFALINGLMMFTLVIMASHLDTRKDLC